MGITVATPGHFDALSSIGLPETTGPVIWWFDPTPGSVCWIGERAAYQWGEFIVDLDGTRNTGVTSDFNWVGDVGNYTQHMFWDGRGATGFIDETDTRASQLAEIAVYPPYPHIQYRLVDGTLSEWFHPFVTKRAPPTDWVLGVRASDGTRDFPITQPFSVSFDRGQTWTTFDPAAYTGPTGTCHEDRANSPSPDDMKHDALQRIKALKEQALARGDTWFLRNLDQAETHVWRSLGFVNPFRPASIAATPAANVTVKFRGDYKIELGLGSSWDPKLASYSSMRLTWSNGFTTAIDLPRGWAGKGWEFRATPWVDTWRQDIRIESERTRHAAVAIEIIAIEASMGFSLFLDSDRVAVLSFTYDLARLWTDATHVDPKHGEKVFDEERQGVRDLLCWARHGGGEHIDEKDDDAGRPSHVLRRGEADRDNDDGRKGCRDDDHRDHERTAGALARCALDPRKWNGNERGTFDAECDRIANLLVGADELLALVALEEAKRTPIRNPDNAKMVRHQIETAERELQKAVREWERKDYPHAIDHFKHSWGHTQQAIRFATR